jgi:hypothetical protein
VVAAAIAPTAHGKLSVTVSTVTGFKVESTSESHFVFARLPVYIIFSVDNSATWPVVVCVTRCAETLVTFEIFSLM